MKLHAIFLLTVMMLSAVLAFGGPKPRSADAAIQNSSASAEVNEGWMLEGQKRYATNCGRCHQPPHKFSPREMAMAVRHMRVRAMLTQDDMKFVMYYMTH